MDSDVKGNRQQDLDLGPSRTENKSGGSKPPSSASRLAVLELAVGELLDASLTDVPMATTRVMSLRAMVLRRSSERVIVKPQEE